MHVLRNVLVDSETQLRVLDHPLEVADEHVEDEFLVADALEVVVKLQRLARTDDLDSGPQLAGGGEGAPLHVGLGDEQDRLGDDPGGGQHVARQGDVLAGVPGVWFQQDRGVRDAELACVLAEVHSLPAGEHRSSSRAVTARENQGREEPGAIKLSAERRDAEVVASQADRRTGGPDVVVHLVVVPDQPRLLPLVVGDGLLLVRHACLPGHPRRGLAGLSFVALQTMSLEKSRISRDNRTHDRGTALPGQVDAAHLPRGKRSLLPRPA